MAKRTNWLLIFMVSASAISFFVYLFYCGYMGYRIARGVGEEKLRAVRIAVAREQLPSFADALVGCAYSGSGLLQSEVRVPAELKSVSGYHKYRPTDADWSAFACPALALLDKRPLVMQIHWAASSTTAGTLEAIADFDGDGQPDATLSIAVTCDQPKHCEAGPITAR
jgi:hypothetical protein